jgi:mitochondrial chaperone BCS1
MLCYPSIEPIKRLLQHTKESYYSDHYARTTIKRPSPQNVRRYGGRYSWTQVANRPVRPMKTVVLDPRQKRQVLADMNEYLHPATPRWYANRGIPLRRGYLFYGPPGTGKTSLSFALAGVFGLDIYVISLLEPTLTEEDLSGLFNSLPRRCVVLLEDIDTAGLKRLEDTAEEAEGKDGKKKDKKEKDTSSRDDWKVSDLARALKKEGTDGEKKGISLSGLLNAIDGVASHEGRVLIMTTNKPESLDEALIRPGRVDLQVGFTNATPQQATELFHRMYEVDRSRGVTGAELPTSLSPTTAAAETTAAERGDGEQAQEKADGYSFGSSTNGHAKKDPEGEEEDISLEELGGIAAEFGAKIPDALFSPAEIQGFLLKRKKSPRKALLETDVWVDSMVKQKETKTKVLAVQ